MAGPITKEQAQRIAKKLDAVDETEARDAHDLWVVYYEGQMVGKIGIRRSSKKDKGHGHVPRDIGVNGHFARLLAQCPKSREDWLRQRNLIE